MCKRFNHLGIVKLGLRKTTHGSENTGALHLQKRCVINIISLTMESIISYKADYQGNIRHQEAHEHVEIAVAAVVLSNNLYQLWTIWNRLRLLFASTKL